MKNKVAESIPERDAGEAAGHRIRRKARKMGVPAYLMQKTCGKSGFFVRFTLYIPMPFPYD